MRPLFKIFTPVLAVVISSLLLDCSLNEPETSGTGTETENVAIAGVVYYNNAPAAGVHVYVRPKESYADTSLPLSKKAVDTAHAVTDDKGEFVIDTIDTGNYVIELDDGDSNLAVIESVYVEDPDSTVEVEDTLKPAGSITGIVYLSENGDPRSEFVLAYGMGRYVMPEADGSFIFGNLGEGTYKLRLVSYLDTYGILEIPDIVVISGSATDLDTIELPYSAIPTPKNVTVSYDTASGTATITWTTENPQLVYGYKVYRRLGTSGTYLPAAVTFVNDTFFMDNLANGLEKGETYQYMVRAVDELENEGLNSEPVTAIIAFYVDAGKDTGFTVGDSIVLVGRVNIEAVSAVEFRWDTDGDGTDDFVSANEDSVKWVYSDTGVYNAVFSAKDASDSVFVDTVVITIVPKDTAGAPSAPRGLTLAYDTLKQIVTLNWSPNLETDVAGYNVYRKHQDSTSFAKIAGVIADTFYVDSSALQDQTYEYKVAAVDSLDTEGTKSGAASAVITSAFLFVRSITMPDSGSSTYNEPGEMAFDLSGNLYVIDLLGNVLKYDAQGISLGAWSTGANEARDIEVLGDSVFVLDRTNKEIIVFNTSGTAQGQWSIDSTSDPMNFVVKHAAVYIVDKQSNHILKYSLAGDSIGKWSGDGNNSFKSLKCIATNPKSDYLYVLDSDSVGFVLDTAGSLVSQFTIPHEFAFSAYTQWFLLHDNNLIYGGKNNFKILVIDLTGKLFAQFGRFGSGPGEFKYPYSIAEAPDNMVYVADKQNSRIQVFRR